MKVLNKIDEVLNEESEEHKRDRITNAKEVKKELELMEKTIKGAKKEMDMMIKGGNPNLRYLSSLVSGYKLKYQDPFDYFFS